MTMGHEGYLQAVWKDRADGRRFGTRGAVAEEVLGQFRSGGHFDEGSLLLYAFGGGGAGLVQSFFGQKHLENIIILESF